MKNHQQGRVTASIRPQREGPIFVAVPSKKIALELAADLMGVSDTGRDLAFALRRACDEEDDVVDMDTGTSATLPLATGKGGSS